MSEIIAQASFNSGEWAPNLFARVDLQKYRSGAALLENWYVDYRGGASTRPGTQYILQAYKSATPVRLIKFQAAFNIGYIMEFGDLYVRFFYQGAPVLETALAITGATKANPAVLIIVGNTYAPGDWIFVLGVGGMTQLNGRFFSVSAVAGNAVTLADLNGVAIDSTGFGTYTTGGTSGRVYTIASPYTAAELALVKFAQSTNEMVLCHPNHPPYLLTLVAANNWTLAPIVFGSSALPPTNPTVTTTLGNGNTNYSYVVTSIDSTGQESGPSVPASLLSKADIRATAGSNSLTWAPVQGAVAYNVYESQTSYFGVVPLGISYGFVGTTKSTSFIDSNIGPNFSESPPVAQNPFVGNGIDHVSITNRGAYTTVPTATLVGGSPSIPAQLQVVLSVNTPPTITGAGTGFVVGDTVTFAGGVVMEVNTIGGGGTIAAWGIANPGQVYSGLVPSSPRGQLTTSGTGTGASISDTWGVGQVEVVVQGAGYNPVPSVSFSSGAASAFVVLTGVGNGNPTVPGFFQQRLVLAGPVNAPQTFYMSRPGAYFNFDISDPIVADDAITGTLVSGTINDIKSMVSNTSGLTMLTSGAIWLINGGSSGSAVSPSAIVANLQSSVGSSDVPPITANYDIIFPQSKGSAIRDMVYNIYVNAITGTDITITASHLFFGYTVTEWAWAEAPYYVVWAVRSDGVMLTLTFLKEQEFVGWTHQTTAGLFKSVATVTESTTDAGNIDAVYTVVQRTVNGNTVQYIERVTDRAFPNGLASAWCVDAGIQYIGAPKISFTGAEHLAGRVVTGLATDDQGNIIVITSFTMAASGDFTLPAPPAPATGYTTVTVGIGYVCDLQTLAIDTSRQQIQSKLKHIPYVDVRVVDTTGLSIGNDFDHLTLMRDLVPGNVSSMLTGQESQIVGNLYSGDARTFLAPAYTVPGQYCIRQGKPYPATVLGVFPCLVTEDDP